MSDTTVKTSPLLASTRQIAEASGLDVRAVRRSMQGIEPAGMVNRGGNLCDGFTLDQLPGELRVSIETKSEALLYRSPEALIENPKPRWEPSIPLSRQPAEMIQIAHKLQRALAYYLQHRNNIAIEPAKLLARAVSDYEAAFRERVTSRHVQNLIARTIERDGGLNDFDRLELYLPRNATVPSAPSSSATPDFPLIIEAVGAAENLAALSLGERRAIWQAALDEFREMVCRGEKPKKSKRKILELLQTRCPMLSDGWEGLRRQFDRKLANLHAEGPAGLCDKRRGNSGRRGIGAEELSPDEQLLLARANSVGGGLSQAWRELYCGVQIPDGRTIQFSDAFRSAFAFDPRESKSYVPHSIRRKLRPLLKSIEPLNHGPKTARLASPSIHRDWSTVRAGAWYQSDDETANHYVWHECEDGEYEYGGMRFNVVRPQILPLIDVRTDYVLSFILLFQNGYNSRAIRSLVLKTCLHESVGLPFEGFYFERGIWKSRNVKALVSWTEIDEAFARDGLNLQMRHATTPKAKVIERIFSREQNMMQELPGYAGRNEMLAGFERTKAFVASLKKVGQPLKKEISPAAGLMSADQYCEQLERMYERFNHEPQNGQRLQGMSPAEAWEKLSGGKMHHLVPDSLRYLLATEETKVKVSHEGICLRFGKERRYFFESARLGMLIGERVNVRWNPDFPDHVVVVHPASDPRGLDPFIVPIDRSIHPMDASNEEHAEAKRTRSVFTQPQRTLFRMIRHTYGYTIKTGTLGTNALRATGDAHNRAEAAAVRKKPSREATEARARTAAREAGLDPSKIKNAARAATELADLPETLARIREKEAQSLHNE